MNNNDATTLLIAVSDVVRAARQMDENAYGIAVLDAYDYAVQFGADDIAEAIGSLPEYVTKEAASAAFAIEEVLATA